MPAYRLIAGVHCHALSGASPYGMCSLEFRSADWPEILVKTERQGICYLCEELSDAWQRDLAYES